MTHPDNKQTKNTNPIISRQDYHLTRSCPSEEKQTKTQHKSHLYTKLTQTTGPNLQGQKPKRRKNSTLKFGRGDLKDNKFNNNEKAEKYYTNEGKN